MSEESFWSEEEEKRYKEEMELNSKDLILLPTKLSDLEKEIDIVKENLDYMEIIRARQIERLLKLQEEYIKHMDASQQEEYKKILAAKGRTIVELSEPAKGILKISLDHLLPHYPKTKTNKMPYYVALTEVYQQELINKLYMERYNLPNFTTSPKVFILIVQYFKHNKISDLDNRFHSFIFNALRSAQITPDDRWQKLSYMEEGRHSKGEEKTEIFVGNYSELFQIIEVSKSNN